MKSFAGCFVLGVLACGVVHADWSRFRGPNGSGVYDGDAPLPLTWSESENLKWKVELPGPGHSSPVITGDRVFVTCWTGYATGAPGGNLDQLERHLLCYHRETGELLWDRAVKARLPEDSYGGMFSQHGYATHTPVTDGERVYVFLGKSGVHAFDVEWKPLWEAQVGDGLDLRGWGSSSSPILYQNLLIVTASPESGALFAFDKLSGEEVWKCEAGGLTGTWGTPVLYGPEGGETLVIAVPGEIWGLNPQTGKLRWYNAWGSGDSACASPLVLNESIIAMGDRGEGAVAVKADGKGDTTDSGRLWESRNGSRIATPVVEDGKLYWIASGIAYCVDAVSGEEIYRERVEGGDAAPAPAENREPGRRGFGGGFGGGGGRGGGGDYASPVLAGGHVYQATRGGEVLVYKTGEKFDLVARNRFASDSSGFSATPAMDRGAIYLRSGAALYCVTSKAVP